MFSSASTVLKFAMTSSESVIINLMVDTARNRVVFADCGGDFVDIILSYLTLPMSSVVRLVGIDDITAGSISNIYSSLLSLENHYFRNEACKSLLLRPLDSAVSKLQSSLAVGVESPSETRSLFYCGNCFSSKTTFCLYSGAKCACGRIMDQCVLNRIQTGIKRAVFVKDNFRYIVTDDLKITKASTDSVIVLLQNFNISDRSKMEEREVHVKSSHVLHLLKCCLNCSDTLLSDAFLDIKKTINEMQPHEDIRSHVLGTQAVAGENSSLTDAIEVKLFVNKFNRTLIHAEANEQFVNLLFNFLNIPVGSIVALSNGQITLGCFQNIHESVESLRTADCIVDRDRVNMLTNPKSSPFSTIKNGQLIKLEESNPEIVRTCNKFPNCKFYFYNKNEIGNGDMTCRCRTPAHCPTSLHDPKQYPASKSTTGFLNKSVYMISDDLNIKPLSGILVASNLSNVAVNGVELITVGVGPQQALALVRASITSKTVLTDVFSQKRGRRQKHF